MPSLNFSSSSYSSKSLEISSESSCTISSEANCDRIIPRVVSQNFIFYEVSESFSSIKQDKTHSMLEKSVSEAITDLSFNSSCNSEQVKNFQQTTNCISISECEDECSNPASDHSASKGTPKLFDNGIVYVIARKFGSIQCSGTAKDIFVYEMTNRNKMSVYVLTYGARCHKILVPDKNGDIANVILSCESLKDYLEHDELYLNATIGRTVGVVKNARFCHGGESFYLSQNLNEKHHCNGGTMGLDRNIWDAHVDSEGNVLMTCIAKDGDEGYPGTIFIQASFCLTENNELRVSYIARSTLPCPCNISNRLYFNLAGLSSSNNAKKDQSRTLYDHFLNVNASCYTCNCQDGTICKRLKDLTNTEYDLRIPQQLGIAIARHPDKGFDCLYKLLSPPNATTKQDLLKFVSRVIDPVSGRALEFYTTENFVWFSTCNNFHEPVYTSIVPDYDLDFLGLSKFAKFDINVKSQTGDNTSSLTNVNNVTLNSNENSSLDHVQILSKTHSELTIHNSDQPLQNFDICLDKELSNPEIVENSSSEKLLKHSAFFLQPQNFPNAVNHQNTYCDIILRPGMFTIWCLEKSAFCLTEVSGQMYKSEILMKFGLHTGKIVTKEGKTRSPEPRCCCETKCPRRFLSRCCDYCDANRNH